MRRTHAALPPHHEGQMTVTTLKVSDRIAAELKGDALVLVSVQTKEGAALAPGHGLGDETVAHLYNPWHPAVLELIARTIRCANELGKEVSVCGEMAGDPTFTELLVGMGLRSFSMHPSQIVAVKQRVLATDAKQWATRVGTILSAEDPEAVCLAFAHHVASASEPRRVSTTAIAALQSRLAIEVESVRTQP